MSLAANWFDEMDDDELDMDRSDDDTLSDEIEPFDQLESGDDELDELNAKQEPDEVPDEGGFDVVVQYFRESARHQLLSVAQEQALTQVVARHLLRTSLESALEKLPARLALIVRMRYGLSGDRPHTLESIAQKLSRSRERVRQIERDAFARLRSSAEVRGRWWPLAV